MTRFFYPASRAHHAYCMAIDFGMKFKNRDGFWTPQGLLTVTGADGYQIVVAKESLWLLQPQQGDIGIVFRGTVANFEDGCWGVGENRGETDQLNRIIERNGISFHWPESDET